MGLQRGFKKAGAKTILMSLWKVDDKATAILMEKFYEYLSKGMDITKALLTAQQYLRALYGGLYDDPYYWAAFVLLDAV
jgi:CHAT domain-containing protein